MVYIKTSLVPGIYLTVLLTIFGTINYYMPPRNNTKRIVKSTRNPRNETYINTYRHDARLSKMLQEEHVVRVLNKSVRLLHGRGNAKKREFEKTA